MIKGFKGYDKDFNCRGFLYEVGKTYETDDAIRCGSKGFHFCENPLDVWGYYPPGTNRYGEVTGNGKIDQSGPDTKYACTHLTVGAEIGLGGLIKAAVQFIYDKSEKQNVTTKDKKNAATTGYRGECQCHGQAFNSCRYWYKQHGESRSWQLACSGRVG